MVALVLRLGQMAVNESYAGPGPLASSRNVIIPPSGTAAAAAVLQQDGAVTNKLVFRAAEWLTRAAGPVRAGEFFISAHASLQQILNILRFDAEVEHQVTIPEGLTGVQIARILNATPQASGNIAPPAEGTILPQTYDYVYGTPRQAILARAMAAMRAAVQKAWGGRDKSVALESPQAALILASIVQQETPVPTELPKIAAVYENRLAKGMKLQADPTVIYAATGGQSSGGAPISRADLASRSPYNTYVFAGLPPGPICTPGLAALDAVLHPAASSALFFVATGAGGHVFADDFKQQLANIARYRAVAGD